MPSKLFRVGTKMVNLMMVTSVNQYPGSTWEPDTDDEHWPHLEIQLLGNTSLCLYRTDLVAAGYADPAALSDAIIAAMDALA